MTKSRYVFHGVSIDFDVPHAPLAEVIDARLRHFRAPANGHEDLVFAYRFGRDSLDDAARPSGSGRPVYDTSAGEVLYFDAEDVLYLSVADRVRVVCEPERGTTLVSAEEEARTALWLLSRPVVTLPLVELLKRRGLFSVHAAGVAMGERAILIAGASGSGKSTLTVALIRAGFDLLGDDMTFLSGSGGNLQIHSFPDEIDVSPASAQWFPELEDLREAPGEGWPKHRVRSEERYGAHARMTAVPAVIVFPEFSPDGTSALEPVPRQAATLRLVANVLLTDPRASQAHLDALQSLVDASDCYRLRLGSDLQPVPELLAGLVPA